MTRTALEQAERMIARLKNELPAPELRDEHDLHNEIDETLAAIRLALASAHGGAEAMRQDILQSLPGGSICDPQAIADTVRALPVPDSKREAR